mgnify:CR=1 FL=1
MTVDKPWRIGLRTVALAYLLARTTDTIADTEIVPVTERLAALARYLDVAGIGLRLERHVPRRGMAEQRAFLLPDYSQWDAPLDANSVSAPLARALSSRQPSASDSQA